MGTKPAKKSVSLGPRCAKVPSVLRNQDPPPPPPVFAPCRASGRTNLSC